MPSGLRLPRLAVPSRGPRGGHDVLFVDQADNVVKKIDGAGNVAQLGGGGLTVTGTQGGSVAATELQLPGVVSNLGEGVAGFDELTVTGDSFLTGDVVIGESPGWASFTPTDLVVHPPDGDTELHVGPTDSHIQQSSFSSFRVKDHLGGTILSVEDPHYVEIRNSAGQIIFQVNDDGSVHIKTGTSIVADL